MSRLSPIIAPKHFKDFTAEEYHAYVKGMYKERVMAGKAKSPAPGIAFTRTKSGALSVRFNSKARAFRYITKDEITAVLKHYESLKITKRELVSLLMDKEFIMAENRLKAEHEYAKRK